MTALLSRWAGCVFWLARYIARAENLARILEVQETFARDSRGANDWRVVLAINADTARFYEKRDGASATEVLRFYVTDRANPTSIVATLHAARENARALRPLISTEMWTQLNVFHNRIMAMRPEEVVEERVSRLAAIVKEGCAAHVGITTGTFYRDEAWAFYQLGAAIECADQITRLVDAKFMSMAAHADAEAGSAVDVSYWTALLRSAAGYQAFRRRHPRRMNPEQVAAFLLADPSFPRSVVCNLGIIEEQLERLRRHYRLRGAAAALEQIDGLVDLLEPSRMKLLVQEAGMHTYNDHLQKRLNELTGVLSDTFFGAGE